MTRMLTIRLPGRLVSVDAAACSDGQGRPTLSAPALRAATEEARRRMQSQLERQQAGLLQARQALFAAVEDLRRFQAEFARQAEEQLLGLSLDIARRVLMQEIQAERYRIEPIIREAMRQVPTIQGAVIHLNPTDFERCQAAGPPPDGVRIIPDAQVGPAECLVETAQGVVDCRVETHLEEIERALGSAEQT